MNARNACSALAIGACLFAAHDAFAGGKAGKKKRSQTIEMTRPASSPDANAQGSVVIEAGAKGETTLHLSHLDPRTVFEVRDASTGALLGDVKTNRKGRATFNLSRSVAKAASAGGADATGDVSNVEVVDPATGDPVLTGDVTPPAELPQFGWASYETDAGDYADVSLSSFPDEDSESFALTFTSSQETFAAVFYDFYRDTANGDELPLGVSSVSELAGRGFQIVAPDGTVVIDDKLPTLETLDCPSIDDPIFGIEDPGFDIGGDWGGDWTYDWGFDGTASDPATGNALRHGGKAKKTRARRGGVKETSTDGFTLLIEDADGVLQTAGLLNAESYDSGGDCPGWDGGGDWGGDWGGAFPIVLVIVPVDGSFDFGAWLDELLSGGSSGSSDLSNLFGFGPSAGNAAKHRGR